MSLPWVLTWDVVEEVHQQASRRPCLPSAFFSLRHEIIMGLY